MFHMILLSCGFRDRNKVIYHTTEVKVLVAAIVQLFLDVVSCFPTPLPNTVS